MGQGWISIHRKIRECVIWDYDEPFTRRDAWIDLLLLANHRDKQTIFDGKLITIKKGQYLTSVRKLAEEWHWGKDKTLKYLRLLEECEMIIRDTDSRRTLITIVNYSIYQDISADDADSVKDSNETVSRHSSATNNNDNNENNENKNKKENKKEKEPRHKYGEYKNVLLSDTDLEKLKKEFPNDWQQRIENVSSYCKSKGKSYSDYLATIRNWARKEGNNGQRNQRVPNEDERQREKELDNFVDRLLSGEEDDGYNPFR